jgi:hypothetical protein
VGATVSLDVACAAPSIGSSLTKVTSEFVIENAQDPNNANNSVQRTTNIIESASIFSSGFESGDVSEWSNSSP